jgi:hypothetical protein
MLDLAFAALLWMSDIRTAQVPTPVEAVEMRGRRSYGRSYGRSFRSHVTRATRATRPTRATRATHATRPTRATRPTHAYRVARHRSSVRHAPSSRPVKFRATTFRTRIRYVDRGASFCRQGFWPRGQILREGMPYPVCVNQYGVCVIARTRTVVHCP